MARKRDRVSDDIYNARRRAKRALAKMQEQLDKNIIDSDKIEETQDYIKRTQKFIEESYSKKYGGPLNYKDIKKSEISKIVEGSLAIQEQKNLQPNERFENFRNDEIFKREINQASIGGVSSLKKEEVKIFYAATQKYWQGNSIEQRNRLIKEGLGYDTLKEVWDYIFSLEEAQEALRKAKEAQKQANSSSDETVSNGGNDETDAKGSPPYIKDLILDLNT